MCPADTSVPTTMSSEKSGSYSPQLTSDLTPEPQALSGESRSQPDKYGFFKPQHVTEDGRNIESAVPSRIVRRREQKWREMLEKWDIYTSKKFPKVRDRCRKGIPSSMRMTAWTYLCGGRFLRDRRQGLFLELESQTGDLKYVDEIKKDLDRQFPQHEFFMSQERIGQNELFRVLKAYSVLRPEVGYCQAQAPIAAILLMHMPTEDAFFCQVEICDKYLNGYYSPGLETVQFDGLILFGLLKKFSPQAHHFMTKYEVAPTLVMTEWFMCVFTRSLPWPCVLRVFDMFLCEGICVLFKVGIVLIDSVVGSNAITKGNVKAQYPSTFELLEALRHVGDDLQEEPFVQQLINLELTREDLIKEHKRQIARKEKDEKRRQKDSKKSKRS